MEMTQHLCWSLFSAKAEGQVVTLQVCLGVFCCVGSLSVSLISLVPQDNGKTLSYMYGGCGPRGHCSGTDSHQTTGELQAAHKDA